MLYLNLEIVTKVSAVPPSVTFSLFHTLSGVARVRGKKITVCPRYPALKKRVKQ